MPDLDHNHTGLARAYLVAALDALGRAGHREATLVVTSTNPPAIGLYEHLGFFIEATRSAADGASQQ
jgi:ribosomal protein S18 acetylase RimI-like enzyme